MTLSHMIILAVFFGFGVIGMIAIQEAISKCWVASRGLLNQASSAPALDAANARSIRNIQFN